MYDALLNRVWVEIPPYNCFITVAILRLLEHRYSYVFKLCCIPFQTYPEEVRVCCVYRTFTATGRIISTHPNLQAVPKEINFSWSALLHRPPPPLPRNGIATTSKMLPSVEWPQTIADALHPFTEEADLVSDTYTTLLCFFCRGNQVSSFAIHSFTRFCIHAPLLEPPRARSWCRRTSVIWNYASWCIWAKIVFFNQCCNLPVKMSSKWLVVVFPISLTLSGAPRNPYGENFHVLEDIIVKAIFSWLQSFR